MSGCAPTNDKITLMKISLLAVTELVKGKLLAGNPETMIEGFACLQTARAGDLSFFYDRRYDARLKATKASVLLVSEDMELADFPPDIACIGVSHPSRSFELIVETYGTQPVAFLPGIHASAVVADSAIFNRDKVSIAANAVIDENATLADGVTIGAGSYVGRGVNMGKDCVLHANVSVQNECTLGERVILHSGVVIGGDGFGYEFENGRHRKIRQAGIVQVDNDVEIGSGSMVDRARFGKTWIGAGTKIDNLVQIGHNVTIGKHCILVAGVAIAGSAQIGDYVVIAAQSGIAGHVKIGPAATLGARSGVTKDLPGGQTYMGFPATPVKEEKRRLAGVNRLPNLVARVKELEARLQAIETNQKGV